MKNHFLYTVTFFSIIMFANIQCSDYPYRNPALSLLANGELQISWMENEINSGKAFKIRKFHLRDAGTNIRNGNHNFDINLYGTPQQIALHSRLTSIINSTNYEAKSNNAPKSSTDNIY